MGFLDFLFGKKKLSSFTPNSNIQNTTNLVTKSVKRMISISLMAIVFPIACTNQSEPSSEPSRTESTEKADSISGIAFDMDGEEMTVEIQDLNLSSEEWDEEVIDANL